MLQTTLIGRDEGETLEGELVLTSKVGVISSYLEQQGFVEGHADQARRFPSNGQGYFVLAEIVDEMVRGGNPLGETMRGCCIYAGGYLKIRMISVSCSCAR